MKYKIADSLHHLMPAAEIEKTLQKNKAVAAISRDAAAPIIVYSCPDGQIAAAILQPPAAPKFFPWAFAENTTEEIIKMAIANLEKTERTAEMSEIEYKRRLLGMSQTELGKISGIFPKNISRWERKQRDFSKISIDVAQRLARAMCCHIENLF